MHTKNHNQLINLHARNENETEKEKNTGQPNKA